MPRPIQRSAAVAASRVRYASAKMRNKNSFLLLICGCAIVFFSGNRLVSKNPSGFVRSIETASAVTPSLSSLSFCEATKPGKDHYALARRTVRDMICNDTNISSPISTGLGTTNSTNSTTLETTTTSRPPLSGYKVVFYHFPKTGGETLEDMLRLGYGGRHATWAERHASKHKGNYVAFTTVRNPYAQILSWFKFCMHGWKGRMTQPVDHCKLAFQKTEEFTQGQNASVDTIKLAYESWLEAILFIPKYTETKKSHELIMPHVQWIGGARPLQVDYILRFEHYASDFVPLAKALGLASDKLEQKNGSGPKGVITLEEQKKHGVTYRADVAEVLKLSPYQWLYTNQSKKYVEMVFGDDLDYFGFSF